MVGFKTNLSPWSQGGHGEVPTVLVSIRETVIFMFCPQRALLALFSLVGTLPIPGNPIFIDNHCGVERHTGVDSYILGIGVSLFPTSFVMSSRASLLKAAQ